MSVRPNMYGTNGTSAPPPNAMNDEIAATLAEGKSSEVTPNSTEVCASRKACSFLLSSFENCKATVSVTPRFIQTSASSLISWSKLFLISLRSNSISANASSA